MDSSAAAENIHEQKGGLFEEEAWDTSQVIILDYLQNHQFTIILNVVWTESG